ncbi:uncharacterized protein LOC111400296 [Olea europaea var. sylvestris]|uniref:uncharacterized protein LOC111400296 n=1 Tax=Olea europaea var. sylvestris TaxID=158386 RepID=UPI000C1D724B|nr:uncharacterized protein LOC111400296 [Olea europaea var. sylvestris]
MIYLAFLHRVSKVYQRGARKFANMVQANAGNPENVICPFKCCKTLFHQHFDVMYGHLIINGMDPTYTTWVFHGKKSNTASLPPQDVENLETYRMYRDAFFQDHNSVEPEKEDREKDFSNLYEGVEIPLYFGCTKYTRISTTVVLYKLKATYGIFDNGFNELLDIIQDMLAHGNTLPNSCNAIKRLLKTFDLGYQKIHTKKIKKGIPAKVLQYFSIIPRFRRMFRALDKAEQLGLSSNGFNPFGDLSSRYSCWPVILVIYNLSHWICMSKENLLLALLIPGPKQPGNDIDVYLKPLIEDLKKLWNIGVEVYDRFTKSTFNLKAVLMWTINDLPAYGNLSGYPTKGEVACPVSGLSTCAKWLTYSRKFSYMGHRRFLAYNQPYQLKEAWFDGNKEHRPSPKILTGQEVMCSIKIVSNNWGKIGKKRRMKKSYSNWPWKKSQYSLSCHIGSILGTILHVKEKSKDGLNSRKDLLNMGIRKELHLELKGNIYYLPTASYMLSKKEKELFCKRLFDLRLLDGYSSNISKCVSLTDNRILNIKSHDCHVLIQQLLLVALRGLLPKGPRNAIFRLCAFFNEICQRVVDKNKLEKLEEDVAVTFCMLELYFPPSFFDIMIHLTIHLEREVRIGRHVQYRWMYSFERFMKTLKGYVRNHSRPEGCIAKRYLADECMHFCSGYMKQAAEDQNSGVSIEAQTICRSSVKDISHVVGKISYYGVIRDIILLDYHSFKIPMLHCDWANIDSGVKSEEGFTLINLHKGQHQFERDPFILTSQAKQVFYSKESDTSNWYIVLKAPPRGFHELENFDEEAYTPSTLDANALRLDITVEDEGYVKYDCDGIDIEHDANDES